MLTRRDLKDKELVQQAELNRLQRLQTVLNSTHKTKSKAAIKMLWPNLLEMILKESGLLSPAPPLYLCSPGRLPFAHAIISSSELLSPFIFRVYRDGRPKFQHQVPVRGEIDFFFDAEPDAVQRMFSVEYKSLHTIHASGFLTNAISHAISHHCDISAISHAISFLSHLRYLLYRMR